MKIITQKELASLAEDAFKNADMHGFYTESTEIETALMLIITEMAEAVQADRKNRHGSIEDYESEIQMGRDITTAYKNSLMERLNPSSLILPSVSYHSWDG